MASTLNIPDKQIEIEIQAEIIAKFDHFCSHQRADLYEAEISDNNILKCPRHG
tara:strand:- start:342 stop:500 length:159 start_codon:yes stop_codon:yes gene_type:complete